MFEATPDYKKELLSKYTEEALWQYYIPNFTLGLFNSPFRRDNFPSFSLYKTMGKGQIKWRDFGTGESGDIFNYIGKLYGLKYQQVVEKIYKDLSKGEIIYNSLKKVGNPPIKKNSKITIDVKVRPYNSTDIQFWKQYGIEKETLAFYKVYPISVLFINGYGIKCTAPTYCFVEKKDNLVSYKIYQPYNKQWKWLNSHNYSVLQGWNQLPSKGELLIVQKSLKDVMLCYQLGWNAIAPQSETSFIKKQILVQLKQRFKKIIIWFDNDEAGMKQSNLYALEHNLKFISIPKEEPKDVSDYYLKWGREKTQKLIKNLIDECK